MPTSIGLTSIEDDLRAIPPGRDTAGEFHQLIARVLEQIFRPSLVNQKIEQQRNYGNERIDIVMDNLSESGFFLELVTRHSIRCPYVLFECKNISSDIGNAELHQLAHRFKDSIGRVGLVICRTIDNRERVLEKCQHDFDDHGNVVLVLDDSDVIELARAKAENGEPGVSAVLRKHLRKLAFRTKS